MKNQEFTLLKCPECNSNVPIEHLQSDEISSGIAIEDTDIHGMEVVTFADPVEAQRFLNKGDCSYQGDHQK
jgi:hypothetical protein